MPYYDEANDYVATNWTKRLTIGTGVIKASIVEGLGYIQSTAKLQRAILTSGVAGVASVEIIDNNNFTDAIFCGDNGLFNIYTNTQVYRDIVWDNPSHVVETVIVGTAKQAIIFINPTPSLPQADTASSPYLVHSFFYTSYNPNNLIYECFTLDLKIIDANGSAINGATVSVTNDITGNNETYQLTTTAAQSINDSQTSINVASASSISAGDYIRIGRVIYFRSKESFRRT
jgi:hypothetical protein